MAFAAITAEHIKDPRQAASRGAGRENGRPAGPPGAEASRDWRASGSDGLLELLQERRVLEGRDVLGDFLAPRDRAQQPPHDLPGARLGQVVPEVDLLRLGDRADLL